jgi:glycerophosphoryl diester phosphodiesterase
MAAFRQAKADGADSCEIDVRQSADGRLFVSHDANFSRISHVDKNCWELTFEQISQLDATGDAWRGRVEPQHYPSLDEVIDWAAEHDMRLNIELKPTGHEVGFEEAVVEAIDVHDFWGSCIVTSQALHAIERVKELSPASVCAYVTSTAYGDICQLEAADAFSLEAITASPSLVSSLHDHDRGVLAWAGDSEPSMRRLVANGVDVLVTDDVSLARRVADEAGSLSLCEKMFYSFVAVLS